MQRSKPLFVRLSEMNTMAGFLPIGFERDNAADVGSLAQRGTLLNLFSWHRLKRAAEMSCATRRGTVFFPKQSVSPPASFFPLACASACRCVIFPPQKPRRANL